MALGDPRIDPSLEDQLYGPEATGLNVAPPPTTFDPWSWMPGDATSDDEEIRRRLNIGGGPPPLAAYGQLPPPPPPAAPTDIVPPDVAALPPDASVPPPLDVYAAYPPPPLALPSLQQSPPELPPPPAPPPDAVTGGLIPLQTATPAPLPLEYTPPPFDPTAANPFGQFTPAESYQIAGHLSPEQLLQVETTQASRKRIEQETAMHTLAEQQLAEIKQNVADRKRADAITQAKEDRIVADSQALAAQGIDRGRWFKNASTGQAIAAIGASLIGGLMSKPGQPNQGIQYIANLIDKDVDDQKYDIENRRADLNFRQGAVAREFARTGDLFQAAETVRQATYKVAIDEIKTRQQDFDRNGVQYLEYGKSMIGMQAMAQAKLEAQREKDREYNLKAIKEQRETAVAQATIQHQRQQIGLGYAQIAEAARARDAARKEKADEKAQERADKETERERQFTISSPRSMMALDDKGAPQIGADGNPVVVAHRFTNADQKPWMLADPEDRRAIKSKIVAASELSDLFDEVKDIRENIGRGIIPWSAARQRLKVLEAKMALIAKSGTQGMSSDKDFDNLRSSVGAKDLTAFWGVTEGLDEARAHTTAELNAEMRAANYTGPPVSFPNKYALKSEDTLEDIRLNKVLEKPNEDIGEATRHIEEGRAQGFSVAYNPDASVEQQIEIQRLGIAAAGPAKDPTAVRAREGLQRAAAEATTGVLRQMARATLETALRSGLGATEATTTSTQTGNPPPEQSRAVAVPDALRSP